jgi:hypothetical protein
LAVLTGERSAATLVGVTKAALLLSLFALLTSCALVGAGFFDGHGAVA